MVKFTIPGAANSFFRFVALSLVVLALQACAGTGTLGTSSSSDVLDSNGVVIVSTQMKIPPDFDEEFAFRAEVVIRRAEDGKRYHIDSGHKTKLTGQPPDFEPDDTDRLKGRISVLSLPPGEYEISDWYLHLSGGTFLSKVKNGKLKFQLDKGTVGYLGCFNIDLKFVYKEVPVWGKQPHLDRGKTKMRVINKLDRDTEIAVRKVPFLQGRKIQYIDFEK